MEGLAEKTRVERSVTECSAGSSPIRATPPHRCAGCQSQETRSSASSTLQHLHGEPGGVRLRSTPVASPTPHRSQTQGQHPVAPSAVGSRACRAGRRVALDGGLAGSPPRAPKTRSQPRSARRRSHRGPAARGGTSPCPPKGRRGAAPCPRPPHPTRAAFRHGRRGAGAQARGKRWLTGHRHDMADRSARPVPVSITPPSPARPPARPTIRSPAAAATRRPLPPPRRRGPISPSRRGGARPAVGAATLSIPGA